MNTEQLNNILDFLESVYDDDRKLNTAVKHFIEIFAPWEYAPVIDGKLTKIFSALKIVYPEIIELLEYYFFESKNMKDGWTIESDWKKYNYSKREDIIQSMIDFWFITE